MTKPKGGAKLMVARDRAVPATYRGKLEANYYCRAWNEKRQKYCKSPAGTGTDHPGRGRCKIHGGLQEGDTRLKHGRYSDIRNTELAALVEQLRADPDPYNVLDDLVLARALVKDFVNRYAEFAPALIAWYDTWEGKYIPIGAENRKALVDVLDAYEAELRERDDAPSADVEKQLAQARAAVDFLATPQTVKPRTILDLSDAVRHVDVLSKVIHRVEQAKSANAVSRPELLRIMTEMGRVLQAHVRDEAVLRRISDGWLSIRL